MNKKTVFIGLLMTFILIGNVLAALDVKIGNGIMILRAETGDKIEKSILVINDNNFSVNIKLTASGDLADDITIKDDNFTLGPGEEKKAFFTIDVKKAGETESRVNVQFTPVGGKNGGVLSSKITVIASDNLNDGADDENVDEVVDTNADDDTNDNTNSSSTGITGNVIGKLDKNMIALGTTLILALVFIVVLIIYYRSKKKTMKNEEKIEKERVVKTKLKKRVKKRA